MYWQDAAALLLGASTYIPQAAAQVITITKYPSTCSAIYTSGSRSVTVVQSTVTVQPVPWNDDMANAGSYFVLQALPDTTGQAKRQATAPRWVMPNGYLTTDGMKAAQYMIKDNKLTTSIGGWISTFEGEPYDFFAVGTISGNLNTTFKITDGKLVWSNTAFTGGVAELFQAPDGNQIPHIIARFYGAINSDWEPYSLYARPANAATEGTSPPPGMSSTAIVSSMGDGMSSMQPPVSASPYQTPTYTGQPTSGGQGGQTTAGQGGQTSAGQGDQTSGGQVGQSTGGQGGQNASSYGGNGGVVSSRGGQYNPPTTSQGTLPPSSAAQSPPASSAAQSPPAASSSSAPTSPDGICGDDSGFVCSGSDCCGTYGYCGTGADYCGDGCQAGFGTCWSASASSMPSDPMTSDVVMPTSYPPGISVPASYSAAGSMSMSMSVSESMPMYSPPESSTGSSSATPAITGEPVPTYATCPDDDGMIITDGSEKQYTIGCGKDTTVGMYASDTVSGGFNECFELCDYRPDCKAFTYLGSVDGVGPGICYYKNEQVDFVFVTNGERMVSGIRIMDESGYSMSSMAAPSTLTASVDGMPSAYSTYTATGTPIAPDNPGGPQSRTSSSSTMETETATSMMGTSTSSPAVMATSTPSQDLASSIFSSIAAAVTSPQNPPAYSSPSARMMSSSISTMMSSFSSSTKMSSSSSTKASSSMMSSSPTSSSSMSVSMSMTTTSNSAPSATHPISSNGHCGTQGNGGTPDGFTCRDSLFGTCCSLSGFCGYSSDYCLAGCQSDYGDCTPQDGNPITISGECGSDWNNATCTGGIFGPCCSTSGFCGADTDYCAAENCDPMFGDCDAPISRSTTTTTSTTTSTSSSSSPAITTTTTSTTQTTTTTTSTTSTSSSAYLVLSSPTPCDFGDPVGYDEDDSYCKMTLPFSMQIYTQSDTNTFAATNGYLSLSYGSSQFASQQFPASNIPNNTVAPFFDDLYLDGSETPKQGIFYQIQGTAVTYEWYVGRGGTPGPVYHFTVKYDSALPGVFTYTYYSTGGEGDQGEFASVGAQGKDATGAAIGTTYAYHTQEIPPGLVVVCNTILNTCVTQS